MGENSKIEWCDATFNPWIGCQKVSRGCDLCYAEDLMATRYKRVEWGQRRTDATEPSVGTRVRTSSANWKLPGRWNKAAAANQEAWERAPMTSRSLQRPPRPRVFCASLADWLDNQVPESWREDLACQIDATPNLDWLLLTKRPENIRRMMPLFRSPGEKRVVESWPRNKNVWLGTSIENRSVLHRIDALRSNPAVVRFLSIEPLLEDLGTIDLTGIHWVIVGGESGRGARPCDLAWIRSIRDQCRAAGVPVFVKQLGANPSATLAESGTDPGDDDNIERLKLSDKKGGDWEEWPSDLRVREFPKGGAS